ncbi:MAG: hypothetical protein Q4G28_10130 [Neisseria sp.]|nr:hypothetical protein [Neisseria sp.]
MIIDKNHYQALMQVKVGALDVENVGCFAVFTAIAPEMQANHANPHQAEPVRYEFAAVRA